MKTLLRLCYLSLLLLGAWPATAFFDPTIGRWASRDPIEEGGGRNLYGFGGNSPIGSIDSTGLAFYVIDGTLTTADDKSNPWYLYKETKEIPARYHEGPKSVVTGADAWRIANNVYQDISVDFCKAREQGSQFSISLSGYSRGAVIAARVAEMLDRNGIWCHGCLGFVNHKARIKWLGLFDAVGQFRHDDNTWPTEIPKNVDQADHAVKTAKQRLFPTWHFKGVNKREFDNKDGTKTTHHDIGCSHMEGDENDAYIWMKQQAIKAGVAF